MNAILFLEYLPWLRLPAHQLELLGVSNGGFAEILVRETTPVVRAKSIDLADAPQALRELYCDNDLGNLRFLGGTSFWAEPRRLDQGWCFADMSEVNLVVAPSGRVEAYAAHPIRGMPGGADCLGVLAKDLESYLEVLFYAQFNVSHFIRGFPDEDPIYFEKTVLVAKHCALIAGGSEYYDVWAGMLSLPPESVDPQH